MSDTVFIQYSRLGRAIFSIEGACLEITQRILSKDVKIIPLHSLSPRHEMRRFRAWRIILLPLAIACVAGLVAYSIWQIEFAPIEMVAIYPGIVAFIFLIGAIRGVPKVEIAQFFDSNERPAFFIVRSRKQADEFDRFVAELTARIASRSSKTPNKSVQHNAGSRPSSGDSPAAETRSAPAPRG